MPLRRRLGRAVAPALAVVIGLASLTSCGGGSSTSDASPEEVLAGAKKMLDETSGVHITLSTDKLPDGVNGVEKAEGVGTHAPAFDGTITAVLSGQAFEVPVVAVDGKVYAQLPLTIGWQDIDPADYGAPDPAQLMDPDQGLSTLLSSTTDVEKGRSVRGGADNKEVLTEYSGTVSGDAVANVIPSASGDFDATYTVADSGELRSARLTGVFYKNTDPMSYTVTFDEYGVDKDITAP